MLYSAISNIFKKLDKMNGCVGKYKLQKLFQEEIENLNNLIIIK